MSKAVALVTLAVGLGGALVGWLAAGAQTKSAQPSATSRAPSELSQVPGDVRMNLVIRKDIPMLPGKAAAQAAHAAVSLYEQMTDLTSENYDPILLTRWRAGGQAKITLQAPDLDAMEEMMALALSLGVNCTLICDAGRTQLEPNTYTVLGLGPAPRETLNAITGHLSLY